MGALEEINWSSADWKFQGCYDPDQNLDTPSFGNDLHTAIQQINTFITKVVKNLAIRSESAFTVFLWKIKVYFTYYNTNGWPWDIYLVETALQALFDTARARYFSLHQIMPFIITLSEISDTPSLSQLAITETYNPLQVDLSSDVEARLDAVFANEEDDPVNAGNAVQAMRNCVRQAQRRSDLPSEPQYCRSGEAVFQYNYTPDQFSTYRYTPANLGSITTAVENYVRTQKGNRWTGLNVHCYTKDARNILFMTMSLDIARFRGGVADGEDGNLVGSLGGDITSRGITAVT